MDKQKKQLHQVVGLDIGTYSLKLVEGKIENNQLSIERVLIIPIPEDMDRTKPESFGKWLAEIWKKEDLKTRTVRLTIPRYEVLTTELDIPSGNESDTVKMLELQVERELPVPVDSIKSDYFVMLKNELGEQKIMVISARNELIQFYKHAIKQAGLHLDRIELSSLSLNRAIQYENPTIDSWIVVNIGHSMTEFMVIDNKNVAYSRSASLGIKTLFQTIHPQADAFALNLLQKIDFLESRDPIVINWINQLVFELKRSLEAYTLEYGKPSPKQMIFYGGGSCLIGLIQILQTKLGIAVQCLEIKKSADEKLAVGSENAIIAAVAFGLILPDELSTPYCDLNRPRLFAEVPYQFPVHSRQLAIGVGTVVVIILILLSILFQKQRHLAQLQAEYGLYRPLVMQSEQINVNMYAIRSWKQEATSILVILRSLSKIWADDAYLQVMTYDRTKDITLSGLASSNQAVAELLNRLNQSNQFTGIKLSYIRASKRNPTYPIEFGLSMKYKMILNSESNPVLTRGQ
jgi:type IV pilus assembly protein PilM